MCWTPPWGSAALWAVAGAAIVELRASVAAPVQAAAGQLRYAQRESPQQLADEPTDGFGVQTAVTKLCAQRWGQPCSRLAWGRALWCMNHSGVLHQGSIVCWPMGSRSSAIVQ